MSTRNSSRGLARTLLAVVALLVATVAVGVSGPAEARHWTPAKKAKIKPGVQMFTKGAQCTANFVFAGGGRVYVGYAAHCAGRGSSTDTNGCKTKSLPFGTRVRFARNATVADGGKTVGHGRLVYSSWRAMHRLNTHRKALCAANDFALVRVNRRDIRKVNPSVPVFGGPTGLAAAPRRDRRVFTYGRSSLRPESTTSPKTGVSLGRTHRGWGFDAYTATPGIPGDSGSGFMNRRGRAVGVLSTVAIAPTPGSNGVGSLLHELRFAQKHSGIRHLHLVRGTRKFSATPTP